MPGALLALPAAGYAQTRSQLRTAPGQRVARVLFEFGGYLVDDTASDSAAICFEANSRGPFEEQFNLTLDTAGGPWYDDLVAIFQGLHVVVSNGPGAAKAGGGAGGGAPIAPAPAPLCG